MKYITSDNFADLYLKAITQVYKHPDFVCSPRGQKINECLNVILELTNPCNNLFKCADKSITMPTGYTKKEIALYLSGTNKAKDFSNASTFWDKIKNDNGTINSAYGNLIFNPSLSDGRSQFEWAFDSLKSDKDSRQAIMRFNNTSHQYDGVKDFPCTFIEIFHIRENKLYATVEMRSNDLVCGLIHDLPSFTLFQYLMYLKLKTECYPELELGTYTHIANSLHLYERDFELTEKRISTGLISNSYMFPVNYNVIKSSDINVIIDIKLNKQPQLFEQWDYPENKDFYAWLLS